MVPVRGAVTKGYQPMRYSLGLNREPKSKTKPKNTSLKNQTLNYNDIIIIVILQHSKIKISTIYDYSHTTS